ncbi:MAG: thioredoxin [Culicoidibacterales bacterium]
MSIEIINSKDEFNARVKEGKYLIDFYASWCGPCQMLTPVLDEISETLENEGVHIIKVDVDSAPDIASDFGVMSIPALFLVKDGENVAAMQGFKPGNQLVDWAKTL